MICGVDSIKTADTFSDPLELPAGADATSEGFHALRDLPCQPAPWLADCLDHLAKLHTLEPNWDSYGAKAVDPISIRRAEIVVRQIAQLGTIPRPSVGASPAGNVALHWEWHLHTRELDLEISAAEPFRFAYLDERRPDRDVEGEVHGIQQIVSLLVT